MIKKLIVRWFRIKYWGVRFENNIPPEFIITKHAQDRMIERLGCKTRDEMVKLVMLAWWNQANLPSWFMSNWARQSKKVRYEYRYLGKVVYVFIVSRSGEQKTLVTIYMQDKYLQ